MKPATVQESFEIDFDHFGDPDWARNKILERRIVAFFETQIELMQKNDFNVAFLSGELMAWGLVKALSEAAEVKLEGLLAKKWGAVRLHH